MDFPIEVFDTVSLLGWAASSAGAGALAWGIISLLDKYWPAFCGLEFLYKRLFAYVLAAVCAVGATFLGAQLGLMEAPVDVTGWLDLVIAIVGALYVQQLAHAATKK